MKDETAVNVFDLVVKKGQLPATLDKLVPLSFIGSAAVKFYKAKVEAMKQLGIAEAQLQATLADGQDAGECLLRIEARIGELYGKMPNARVTVPKSERAPLSGGRVETAREAGIDDHRGRRAVAIHSHPEAVERVIKESRENGEIPTRTAVLTEIAKNKMHEKLQRRLHERPDVNDVLSEYITSLNQINAGLGEIIDNWEAINSTERQRFHSAARIFVDHIKTLGGKKEWKALYLLA